MRKHITFNGMSSHPTDHESADGQCAALYNLIAEDGALRPLGPALRDMGTVADGSSLVAVHAADGYRHLILHQPLPGDRHAYHWTDGQSPLTLHALFESDEPVNTFAAVGATLCLVLDNVTHYALWDEDADDYCVIGHDDLRYDLTVTQDSQQRREVTLPLSDTLAAHLDAPTTVLGNRPSLVARVFPGYYDNADAYATGATMVAAAVESTIDHEKALLGQGTHKHVHFGIAALRLADGSHTLFSNVFALLPATLPTRVTADREAGTLHATAYLHRHAVTIDMHEAAKAARVVTAVDIFLTREVSMLDHRQAATIVTDMEGRVTALSFGHLDRQATMREFDNLTFYKALSVGPGEWGVPVMVPQIAADGEEADLGDLRRWQAGARVATSHDGRLTLGNVGMTLPSPFDIRLTYQYHTLDAATRRALDPDQREAAIDGESIAGSRADIDDQPLGQTCDLVVTAKTVGTARELCWRGEVQYPIPGMMMFPSQEVSEITYHARVATSSGMRYNTTTRQLEPLHDKGFTMSVHTATGQPHRVTRPALHSLLLQQAQVLAADLDTGVYESAFMLWQPSDAATWQAQADKAREQWTTARDTSLLRTSTRGNALVLPEASAIHVGDGEVTRLVSNTRRTADGLFGDSQHYAFTTKGIWVLRLADGRWKAQQTVSRDKATAGSSVVATADAVVYVSSQGVMMVKGSVSTCLSDALRGLPFPTALLPGFDDIVRTEPALTGSVVNLPPFLSLFIPGARMRYDCTNQRLWFHNKAFPHLALVFSLRSKTWGMAATAFDSIVSDGDKTWALQTVDGIRTLVEVSDEPDVHERRAVLLCSRPMALGLRHVPKTVVRVMVRGLFNHRPGGSHLGVALYGSDDLLYWRYIGSSANQYLRCRSGKPCKWFRVVAIGQLLPGESIEGVSIEAIKRMDNKMR